MAKTSTQRTRIMRQRRKWEEMTKPDSTYPFLKEPFFKWLERTEGYGDWGSGTLHLDSSQITIPEFLDDTGPHSIDGEVEKIFRDNPEESCFAGFEGSIGRAELLVDDLISAASNFALVINRYKREQINARIQEIEESDLADPDIRKKALADIVRLRKMLERLEKLTRHSTYEYKIKDI